jgi:protein-arginine kinase activator protein McsA
VRFKNWGKIKFSENYTEDTYLSKKILQKKYRQAAKIHPKIKKLQTA